LPAGCRLCQQLFHWRVAASSVRGLPGFVFSRIRGSICRECGVRIDRVSISTFKGLESSKWTWSCRCPLHKVRRCGRGFNQAELLSERLAKRLRLPRQSILLVRRRPSPDKHLLTSSWEAVRGAFATPSGSQVDKQRVLLVDDVMTTGATLDAYAKALREAGAAAVLGVTVARAILNPQKFSR
jgi:predicted amidophosphoribosyltransferase